MKEFQGFDKGIRLSVFLPQVPFDPKYPIPPQPGVLSGYNELVVVGTFSYERTGGEIVPLDPIYQEVPVTKDRPGVILSPTGLIPLEFFSPETGRKSVLLRTYTHMLSGAFAGSLGIRWKLLTKEICGNVTQVIQIADAPVSLEEFWEIDKAAEALNEEFRLAKEALQEPESKEEGTPE
jgi:hypothetical protein